MKAFNIVSGKCSNLFIKNILIHEVDSIPPNLIKKISIESEGTGLTTARNQEYFQWRYFDNIDDYKIFGVIKDGREIGYYVLKFGRWKGLLTGYIADYYISKEDFYLFPLILNNIITYFYKKKVKMISTWVNTSSQYYKIFKRKMFMKYQDIPVICYKNQFGINIIESEFQFHFTMSDTDNI